jgi:hypothetical protein
MLLKNIKNKLKTITEALIVISIILIPILYYLWEFKMIFR